MGKLALAAKITHVPSMYLSELPGPRQGTRQDAIDGHVEIGRRCRELGVDTIVVFDTHWLVNANYHINCGADFQGLYTSNELPHFISNMEFGFPGNPKLGQLLAKACNAWGVETLAHDRTTLEPAPPVGLDITKDELAFYPIIYWPISASAPMPSTAAINRIDAYMRAGGTVLFDTRDQFSALDNSGGAQSANGERLQQILANLDIPPLEPVPSDHVLTKSFYLMRGFPGRWDGGMLWVEAQATDENRETRRALKSDGVSSILITSNDFAGAWAMDDSNRAVFAVVPGGEVQREMAFRSGVNIVMYALTGNYKADQVHVPALLERLGQ